MKPADLFSHRHIVAVVGIAVSTPVLAENYDIDVWNSSATAPPVEQAVPAYPAGLMRTGQEGWVRMHFVVTEDGKAVDPIIVDSSGGAAFEAEARESASAWRFDRRASSGEDAHNLVNIRSEVRGSRDSATKSFRRKHRRIALDLVYERNDEARVKMDELSASVGFNTYESTMLWLLMGRVEGVEDNDAGKLECYRRALSVSTLSTLRVENRLSLLEKIFWLEDQIGHFAASLQTFRTLETASGETPVNEDVAARAAEIQTLVDSEADLVAQATVYNPCDCEEGRPLWYYKPVRRTFSFANLSGNVESFEARCEHQRVQGPVEAGTQWTLAPEWGSCRVFVFGDDGATFEFVEHQTDVEVDAPTAVAEDDVLDRRSRGQRS